MRSSTGGVLMIWGHRFFIVKNKCKNILTFLCLWFYNLHLKGGEK
jgi:hypothetical protein